jgi:hypothetical protein
MRIPDLIVPWPGSGTGLSRSEASGGARSSSGSGCAIGAGAGKASAWPAHESGGPCQAGADEPIPTQAWVPGGSPVPRGPAPSVAARQADPFKSGLVAQAQTAASETAVKLEGPLSPGTKRRLAELDHVSRQFESLLFKEMVHSMVEGSTDGGFFGRENGGETWEGLFESGLSDSLGSGGSLGMGGQIYRQFEKAVLRQADGAPEAARALEPAAPDR